MRYLTVLFAALVALASDLAHADTSLEIKGDRLTLIVDVRENANLIYQLDCLADTITCAPDIFQTTWRGELQFNDADQKMIDQWKALREAIQYDESGRGAAEEIETRYPLPPSNDDTLWNRLTQAEYSAANDRALDAAWARFMSPSQHTAVRAVFKHFKPRFHLWWRGNQTTALTFAPALKDALVRARGFELIAAAARFYRADVGAGRLQVHLIALPKGKLNSTRAGRVAAHLTIEVVPGENSDRRAHVAVHELAHYVLGSMPHRLKVEFMERMLAAGTDGIPSWNLFEEVQASAIGNVLAARNGLSPEAFQKEWDRPQSFYAVELVDLGARATYRLFEKEFASGGPMSAIFPTDFVQAMHDSLGAKLQTPAAFLGTMASINLDSRDNGRKRSLRRGLRASIAWEYDAENVADFMRRATRYPALSVAVLARRDGADKLGALEPALALSANQANDALASSAGVILVSKRSADAYAFVLVARDDASMDALIAALPQCSLTPGVCRRL